MKKSIGAGPLAVPAPVWCIGSYDENGTPNLMTAAWCGICSSNPPSVTVSLQKARHTYDYIMKHKAFTVNVPSVKYAAEADYVGIPAYAKPENDKFAEAGLTPVKGEFVNAPYVDEFPLVLECRLIGTVENGVHTLFIGEIVDVKAEESVLGENGRLDIAKIDPLIFTPVTRSYHAVGEYVGQAFSIGVKK